MPIALPKEPARKRTFLPGVARTGTNKVGQKRRRKVLLDSHGAPNEDYHREQILHARELLARDNGQSVWAASHILRTCTAEPPEQQLELSQLDADLILIKYAKFLLRKRYYIAAALLLWGPEMFTPEPRCTQLVWGALMKYSRNLIMGGGSLSKTYSGAVHFALDFLDDPQWTCIKVVSVTGEHARRNIFANIKMLLQNTIVPWPGLEFTNTSIQVSSDDKQGIHLVTIPTGEDGKGRLRGFHPVPRIGEDHERYGRLSRIRVLLDEAEEIPTGVWEDVNNILLTDEEDSLHVSIMAATNPRDRTSRFAEYAEPKHGWSSIGIEESEEWESARGWHVTRLDGARCENVMAQAILFPGLQTYAGYESLLKLGPDNPEYYTMGRGWYPEASAQRVIVTSTMFDRAKGIFTFSGPTTTAAGVDLAFEGNDLVPFTLARFGMATGWTDQTGLFHPFSEESRVIQLEQQFLLDKKQTLDQARAIAKLCKETGVKPRWLAVDRTGNGAGVHDALQKMFGPEVFGVMFSWRPTDTYILEDDTNKCEERYHDIITEMAFSLRSFMEIDLLKLNPGINWNFLERETTHRYYQQKGRGILCIESKTEFKRRNKGRSPDRFDSAIVCVHGIRMNGGITGKMVDKPLATKSPRQDSSHQQHGIVDTLEFVDMSD